MRIIILARWDYTVSEKDSIFLRFVLDKQYLLEPFPPSGSLIPLLAGNRQ